MVIKGIPPLSDLPVEDVIVERCVLWCGWGKTIEPGIETWASAFRRVRFSDCDLIRNVGAALNVSAGGSAVQEDIVFENIRVELQADTEPMIYQNSDDMRYNPARRKGTPLLVKVDNTHYGRNKNEPFGHVRNCTFRNVNALTEPGVPPPQIQVTTKKAPDGTQRPFENVTLENFSINGKPADWGMFSFATNTPVVLKREM